MTIDLYLGVGHGKRPDGVYDPGAVCPGDDTQEHTLAHKVVDVATAALKRSGVTVFAEQDSGAGHDPNFSGSVARVNAGDYSLAVEVHFDWSGAPRGGFGLYISDAGSRAVDAIHKQWVFSGLPVRTNTRRTDLSFLSRTNPPAVIWESDNVCHSHDNATLGKMGEALARGICEYLDKRFVPPRSFVIRYKVRYPEGDTTVTTRPRRLRYALRIAKRKLKVIKRGESVEIRKVRVRRG